MASPLASDTKNERDTNSPSMISCGLTIASLDLA
jgi:hypothetical protein